jgi:hypothetical protein
MMARIPKRDLFGEESMLKKECKELWENDMYNKEMILYQDEERVVVFEEYVADIREGALEIVEEKAEEYLTEEQKEGIRSRTGVPVLFEK